MELSKSFLVFSQKNTVLIFHKTETLKSFLYSLQRKHFLLFWKQKSRKKFFIFQETELSYSSGSNFQSLKSKKNPLLKNFSYFGKWNFLAPSLKNFLYFRRELAKPEKQTKKPALKKFLVSYDVFTILQQILCEAKIQHRCNIITAS